MVNSNLTNLLFLGSFLMLLTGGYGVITQGPVDTIGIEGRSVSLSCTHNMSQVDPTQLLWIKTRPEVLVVTENTLPEASTGSLGTTFYLNITNLKVAHEGSYRCSVERDESNVAALTVEVPPVLSLDPWFNPLSLEEGKETKVTCTAASAKPAVDITWSIEGQPANKSQVMPSTNPSEEAGLQDTVSILTFTPNRENSFIQCSSSPLAKVPAKTLSVKLNILYKPSCSVEVGKQAVNRALVRCSCDANPPVSGEDYQIIRNDTEEVQHGKEANLTVKSSVSFSCAGTNSVGSTVSEAKAFEGGTPSAGGSSALITVLIWAPLCIVCIVIIVVVVVFIPKKGGEKRKGEDGNLAKLEDGQQKGDKPTDAEEKPLVPTTEGQQYENLPKPESVKGQQYENLPKPESVKYYPAIQEQEISNRDDESHAKNRRIDRDLAPLESSNEDEDDV